jgi:hypothetical protein
MSADERKIAERMLMNELKELSKENWVDAEVCSMETHELDLEANPL